MRTPGEMGAAGMVLAARLFFEDNSLRETALKLARLIEGAASPSRPYFEALGVVLAHELARLNAGVRRREAPERGGLAGWQQRIVSTYIDERDVPRLSASSDEHGRSTSDADVQDAMRIRAHLDSAMATALTFGSGMINN